MNKRLTAAAFLLFFNILMIRADNPEYDGWGINSNFESDEIADAVSKSGVSWARLAIPWDRVETSKGVFDWMVPDVEIQRAVRKRVKLFVTLGGTPKWANGGKPPNVPPLDSNDWYEFVKAVASRYEFRPFVKAYGMWNEPDLQEFWVGDRNTYIKMILRPGSMAVKSVNPDLLVAGPEMSDRRTKSSEWNLRDTMKSVSQYIDVLTQHYYGEKEDFGEFLDKKVGPHRMGKDVWITECGTMACTSARCSEDKQTHYYLSLMRDVQARSDWVKKIFPYRIWDPSDECGISGNGFGLSYGPEIVRRSAYKTYQDFIWGLPFVDPQPECHGSSGSNKSNLQ